ncbi:hypothetical protein GCM10010831_23650 [Psychroflexus salis]|uniref:Uncharacterized protein n=1 Tax=Psychroflexus salis TaxID=1526574 RepID=A0A917A297_9FLAO|nr:hypothetical protein GCM10010831_23650 [Psychroflexus salis]
MGIPVLSVTTPETWFWAKILIGNNISNRLNRFSVCIDYKLMLRFGYTFTSVCKIIQSFVNIIII